MSSLYWIRYTLPSKIRRPANAWTNQSYSLGMTIQQSAELRANKVEEEQLYNRQQDLGEAQ